MKGLINNRLRMASKADYTNAKDVQKYLQEFVNYEALMEWARGDERQGVRGVVPPSKLYEPVKRDTLLQKIIGLIP